MIAARSNVRSSRLVVLLLLACVGCDSSSPLKSSDGGAGAEGGVASLPACTWPATLDDPDAGRGACRPARARLSCDSPNSGVHEVCVSEDPNHCSGDENVIPGATFICHDTCAANEYAAVCGAIGPGPIADPPAGCHDALASPGGTVFYCCPCL
jgi:hypothetical protein